MAKKKVLTQEMADYYKKWNGLRCPFCKVPYESIEGESDWETEGMWVTRTVRCTDCETYFQEYFEMTAITLDGVEFEFKKKGV